MPQSACREQLFLLATALVVWGFKKQSTGQKLFECNPVKTLEVLSGWLLETPYPPPLGVLLRKTFIRSWMYPLHLVFHIILHTPPFQLSLSTTSNHSITSDLIPPAPVSTCSPFPCNLLQSILFLFPREVHGTDHKPFLCF